MDYSVNFEVMKELMGLVAGLLQVHIGVFGLEGTPLDGLGLPGMSEFCESNRRRDPAFWERCTQCDRDHLQQACATGTAVIYRCHAGLYECVIPLLNRQNVYMGAITLGQMRPAGLDTAGDPLLQQLRPTTEEQMRAMAQLLKIVSEYVIRHDLIQFRRRNWSVHAEKYLEAHWRQKITLAELARHLGCSASYLSHHFSREFGMPLRSYLRNLRLTKAREMLKNGQSVKETAQQAGFYDEFHFAKAFKKEFGFPPGRLTREAQY